MANPGALPPKPVPPIGPRIEEELRSIYHLLDKLTMTQCRPVPPIQILTIADEVASIKSMLEKLTGTKQEEEKQMFAIVPVSNLSNIFAPYGTTIRTTNGGNGVLKFTVGKDDRWRADQDWNLDDEDRVIIGVEHVRGDGESETDGGESEEDQVTAADAEGVAHKGSVRKGARDAEEPHRKRTRTESLAD